MELLEAIEQAIELNIERPETALLVYCIKGKFKIIALKMANHKAELQPVVYIDGGIVNAIY